jgi:hypothetical protein
MVVISDGIPAVPRNKHLSEFRSEPFLGSENSSEFRSVEQKQKQTLGMPFRTIPRERKHLRTMRSMIQEDKSRRIAKNDRLYDFTVWMIVKNIKWNGTSIVKKCPQFNGTSQGLNKLV